MSNSRFAEKLSVLHAAAIRHGVSVDLGCDVIHVIGCYGDFRVAADTKKHEGETVRRIGMFENNSLNPIASLTESGAVHYHSDASPMEIGRIVSHAGRALKISL